MIKRFVERWFANKDQVEAGFRLQHPGEYADIVRAVISMLHDADVERNTPDPERLTQIDHGNYQGTLCFVVACGGYQPSKYWGVTVDYGSCSGCDTLQGIRAYSNDPPTDEQVAEYKTLALHVVQRLSAISNDEEQEA